VIRLDLPAGVWPGVRRVGWSWLTCTNPGTSWPTPKVRALIDFAQPVALLLVAILPFITDREDPARILNVLYGRYCRHLDWNKACSPDSGSISRYP
jgi:hypothetical protein